MFLGLIVVGLIVAVIQLWQKSAVLHARVEALEGLADFRSSAVPTERVAASPLLSDDEPRSELISLPHWKPALDSPAFAPVGARAETQTDPLIAPPEIELAVASPRIGFEDLFGRRLPIWAGGITLAVAGALIVRFSIDAGLFPPEVRVTFGLLFGAGLLGGAEAAYRKTDWIRDPRVAQALAGAGIASFYSSILVAANLYHLIAPLTAFIGLAGVTAAAMGLALRFGPPTALLGLVGGLAAPALVGSGPANIPLLATYLALVVGGLSAVSRRQRWAWLGIGALVGGFGWGGVLILSGTLSSVASASIGIYILLIGLAFPMLASEGARSNLIRVAGSLAAAIEIAAMIALGGFAMLDWGLFGLISIGIVWLARRDVRLASLPALGLAVALPLIAGWPHPGARDFILVMIGTALIYGVPALRDLWRARGGILEAGQIAALGVGGLLLSLLHFHHDRDGRDILFGSIALLCAMLPACAAMMGWRVEARRSDARLATLVLAAAALVAAAGVLALPLWAIPAWVAGAGLVALLLANAAEDRRIEDGAWALAGVSILVLAMLDNAAWAEAFTACGWRSSPPGLAGAVARWILPASMMAAFAWKGSHREFARAAQVLAVLTSYVAGAQIVSDPLLPLVPAVGLVLLMGWSRSLDEDRLLPAMAAAIALSVAWAIQPLATWAVAATASTVGIPILVASLPDVQDSLLRLLLPAAAIAAALAGARVRRDIRIHAAVIAALPAAVAIHSLYKQLFALASHADFVARGLAERTVWEAGLLGAGLLVWRLVPRRPTAKPIAVGFAAVALAHGLWYSSLLHNPLWADQSVGALPLLNWLIAVYALPLLILWLAGRGLPQQAQCHDRIRSIAQMLLILLFGFSELRQIIHGALLTVTGVTRTEDVLRSVAAIGIAIGFLLWGLRRPSRDWRIGSLLLMLAAVGKVFLVDAAGLDGLLRIASFVALGFSLIGIGWLYSRYLNADRPLPVI